MIKCKKAKQWDRAIQVITHILSGLLIFLSISILIVIMDSLLNGQVTIFPRKQGVDGMIAFWKEYAYLLSSLFWIATLFVASQQLANYLKDYHKRIALEEAKAIIEIRNFLDYDKANFRIHTDLELGIDTFPKKNCRDRVKWNRYLGTIELIGIMLKKGIISDDVFNSQFGYRVSNIRSCKSLMEYIESDSQYWTELLDLIHRVEGKIKNTAH